MTTVPEQPQAVQPSSVAAEEPDLADSSAPATAETGDAPTAAEPGVQAEISAADKGPGPDVDAPEPDVDAPEPDVDAPEPGDDALESDDDDPESLDGPTDPAMVLAPEEDDSDDEVLILDDGSSDADSSADDSDDEVLILDAEPSQSEVRLAELEARVAVLEVDLAAAQEEARSNKNRLLRTAADYENFRRRTTKEKEDLEKFSAQRVVREFLPVMDNLERALKHSGDDVEVPASSLREGVDMVMKQFRQSLEKQGVIGFDSEGEMFDPQVHEAIQQVDTVEHPTGTIINEFQRGYHIHDKLLRPALVVVARNTSEDDE